jgi:hypothetical protein
MVKTPLPASPLAEAAVTTDWRHMLPVLTGASLTLRELEIGDATALFAMLTTREVARFISPPPTTIDGFERFNRVDAPAARGGALRLLRRGAARHDDGDRSLSNSIARTRVRDRRVGVRDWIGILGLRRIYGRSEARG